MSARSSAKEVSQDNGLPKTLTPNPKIANPLIPRLVDICTDTIVNNFSKCLDLHLLPRRYQTKVIQKIPSDFPLHLAVMAIPDGPYWKRRLLNDYPDIIHDPKRNTWKRLYLEHYSSKAIENATEENIDDVFNELRVLGPYIHEIKLVRCPCKVSIFKLFRTFRGLRNLSLVYGEPRRNFAVYEDFDQFDQNSDNHATKRDCELLCSDFEALGTSCCLESLDMSDNSLDDRSFQRVAKGLFALNSVKSLAFAHNEIGDKGAHAIASVMLKSPLEKLNLADNHVGAEGMLHIAEIANSTHHLRELNLSSNQIGNDGVMYVAQLVKESTTLEVLDISGNRISDFHELIDALKDNKSLKHLNLAANPIDPAQVQQLQAVIADSQTLDTADLRVYELKPEDFEIKTTETSEAPLLRFK